MSVKLNRRLRERLVRIAAVNLALLLTLSVVTRSELIAPAVYNMANGLGGVCAAAVIPDGLRAASGKVLLQPTDSTPPADDKRAAATTTAATTATAPTTAATKASSSAVAANSAAAGRIVTQTIGMGGANLVAENLHISNKTGVSVNLSKQLKTAPSVKINKKSGEPQVLILHTHGTECYYPKSNGSYQSSWPTSSTDSSKNVVAVGAAISSALNAAGIKTLHDKTQYDRTAYSGSYERARTATAATLKKHPSIQVVLDIHRDSIATDGGKLKPTATIDGKPAAQLLIATGCQSGTVTAYPDWLHNFRFACALQSQCERDYSGLVRPMYFVSKKYNHDLCRGSLLIEFGSETNTLDEALYSAKLFSSSLVRLLNTLD